MTFLPSRPPRSGGLTHFYKTFVKKRSGGQKKTNFCKNAQWMAKKLRERGSNTARPTEKGGGVSKLARVLSIFGRDLRTSSWRFVPIRSISARRFGRFGSTRPMPKSRRKHKKKPDSSIGESGCSYRNASRALNLRLVPLSNTCASDRSVR